jgi:hypothetical protein
MLKKILCNLAVCRLRNFLPMPFCQNGTARPTQP